MAATAPASSARKLLDERLSQLSSEVEMLLDREIAAQLSAARRELCESFNQALRRLRSAAGWSEAAAVLAGAAADFCNPVAIFRISNGTARGEIVRGVEVPEGLERLSTPLTEAPALRAAVETGDPVFSAGTADEVSEPVAARFSPPSGRVGIFPIPAGNAVVGLVYAAGVTQPAMLEALAQAAGAVLEAREARPAPAAEEKKLVSIEPAPAPAPPASPLQLRAQRNARVQVAEMRLYHPEAVKAGRESANLYGALKDAIDAAREAYRHEFLGIPGMPDYLHLELLHTLALDDVGLLGEKYPGPLC